MKKKARVKIVGLNSCKLCTRVGKTKLTGLIMHCHGENTAGPDRIEQLNDSEFESDVFQLIMSSTYRQLLEEFVGPEVASAKVLSVAFLSSL